MPELGPVSANSTVADEPIRQHWPIPYPGMPRGLEQLSMAERLSWGQRYSVDQPAYMTPSGFGEMIPLTLDQIGCVRDLLIYPDGPSAR